MKAMVICKRSSAVVKKLPNYEHLALSKTKKQTQVALGLINDINDETPWQKIE